MADFGKNATVSKDSTVVTATALDTDVPSAVSRAAGASNEAPPILEDDKSDDGLKTNDPERNETDDERKLVNGGPLSKMQSAEHRLTFEGNDVARYVASPPLRPASIKCDKNPSQFPMFRADKTMRSYFYKPVDVSFASVFLCLIAYVIGVAWSVVLPRRQHVEKYLPSQAKWLGPVVHFINPGHFGLKEHAVASILSTSSGNGAAIVQVFGAERLFYNRTTDPATAVLTVFSASIFGYGLVGILRSIIVHRADRTSEMVWWQCLPTISICQTLHREPEGNNKDRLRMFGFTSIGMFIWEPIASYIWPWLNGISIPCLASMKAAPPTRKVLMTIFDGINSNEGQGIFNFSLDWQYITSRYMSLPLLQQANSWVGIVLSYIMCFSLYYGGAWGAKKFPFMSTAMFDGKTGKVYNQTAVFGQNAILDTEALAVHGFPRMTASNVWANMAAMAAIGALLTHIALFYGPLKLQRRAYLVLSSRATPPLMPGHTFALFCSDALLHHFHYACMACSAPASPRTTFLRCCGVVQPGKPVANLYFSMFSHEVTVLSVFLSTDLKMAQYLKIPWRTMFILQTWGSLFGTALNYVIMDTIVANRREILLDPIGTQVVSCLELKSQSSDLTQDQWSGRKIQSLNTTVVTWSLAKYVYGFGKDGYGWIPLSIVVGAAIPVALWLVSMKYKTIYGWEVSKFITPVVFHNASETTSGTTSVIWSQVVVGLWSQWYMRLRHPAWFGKYNYIIGGGLDAGAKVMMFILTFAVAGGSGKEVPFLTWWGNPESSSKQYADYCGTG
ncbi:oligopeptide transporter 8 [Colletotrichum phormii]|uniref:Oligopeptide transporter 8 n=1 Tax=Colletotrichum phormii TaxID=359342 RepID=A0AAJ0EDP3_9PEZI|nr:oligopeptide transporter 8 [Colletotrichum phormii]KAK1633296.1 oligopeptide transporter 8 [Colletotrichum phormii]